MGRLNDIDYSHLRPQDRRRVAVLTKRANHLAERVAGSSTRLTYDEAELDAILWSLSIIAEYAPGDCHEHRV